MEELEDKESKYQYLQITGPPTQKCHKEINTFSELIEFNVIGGYKMLKELTVNLIVKYRKILFK